MALAGTTPRETAEDVYRALAPAAPDKDFRVAVACVLSSLSHPNDPEVHIINRYERT
jgi:hypothetical protein